MGVIQRQGIKNSIVNYLAVGIGALSTIFIYPKNLEFYGLAQYLFSMATLIVPIASFGVVSTAVKFFPEFRDDTKNHNGLLFFLIVASTISFIISIGIAYIFKDPIYRLLENLSFRVDIISDYRNQIIALTYILILIGIYTAWTSNFKRIVVPAIVNNLFIRIALPTLILLSIAEYLDIQLFTKAYILCYFLIALGLLTYIGFLKELKLKPDLSFLTKERIKRLFSYSLYSGLSKIGTVLAFRLDIIMVTMLLGVKTGGAYGIFLFLANTLAIPTRAINSISSPIIANHWKQNNISALKILYKKSAEQLLAFGSLLFLLIIISLTDIIALTGGNSELVSKYWVFVFLGLANIVDMATSINSSIIIYSKKFRYNLLFVGILAVLNIFLNYYLIKNFFLEGDPSIGAALATFISIVTFNFIKVIFLYWTYKMQPFTKNTIAITVIAIVTGVLVYWIPLSFHPFFNMLIKSCLVCVVYLPSLYFFNLAPEVWALLNKYLPFIKKQ